MFTGIIEKMGKVERISAAGSNLIFTISSELGPALHVDQSVCHNGVCLTVEEISGQLHQVSAVDETLKKTNLSSWQPGTMVNLERCMTLNGRLDGHIVQGHADGTAVCLEIKDLSGSWLYTFGFDLEFAPLIIEKGSVAVNGISLTAFGVKENLFQVAIVPYTFEHTSLRFLQKGDSVNIEFDVLGKYVQRSIQLRP
jgi:riboflavin synthase